MKPQTWLPYRTTTHYLVKSKCVVFYLCSSFSVQLINITVNKATFIDREIMNP